MRKKNRTQKSKVLQTAPDVLQMVARTLNQATGLFRPPKMETKPMRPRARKEESR